MSHVAGGAMLELAGSLRRPAAGRRGRSNSHGEVAGLLHAEAAEPGGALKSNSHGEVARLLRSEEEAGGCSLKNSRSWSGGSYPLLWWQDRDSSDTQRFAKGLLFNPFHPD